MKKILLIAVSVLFGILLLMLVLPALFRGKVAEIVQDELDKKVNGTILFKPENLSLSLISSFPYLKVSIQKFGIINKAPFEGDTLFYAENFALGISMPSVLSGGQIHIRKILLEDARIRVYVFPDGSNNYAIFKLQSSPQDSARAKTEPFSLSIDSWELNRADIRYLDARSSTALAVHGLQHSGSGDFSDEIVELTTKTSIESLSLRLDSVQYFTNRRFSSEMEARFDQKNKRISFGENYAELNAFRFAFQGDASFGGAKPTFNLKFSSPESSVKGLISLIPSIYLKDYENVKADGKLSFDGHIRGEYDSLNLPDFSIRLKLENGGIQYPNLPEKVENIELDLILTHAQGSPELLQTELKKFRMKIGRNTMQVSGKADGISSPQVRMLANGSVNLAELSKALPSEGLTLKGILGINASVNGKYNKSTGQFPVMKARLLLKNGYVKSERFPEALDGLNLDMTATNTNGKISGSAAEITQLRFRMAGDTFGLNASLKNPDNLQYRVKAQGMVDFGKMTKLFPLDGIQLSGKMQTEINASGMISDVLARNYDRLPTSGKAVMRQVTFRSAEFTEPVQIEEALLIFSSEEVKLSDMQMKLGKSDFRLSGSIRNHLAYIMQGKTLQGAIKMQSELTDANQLIALRGGTPPTEEESNKENHTGMEPFPDNLEMVFESEHERILYDNLELKKVNGSFSLKAGVMKMDHLRFGIFDGDIQMDGKFDPRNPVQPEFTYTLAMRNLSVPETYQKVTALQVLVPVAKYADGRATGKLQLKGSLDAGMNPVLTSLNGGGKLRLSDGMFRENTIINGINTKFKTRLPAEFPLKDLFIKFSLVNGRVNFEPFDLKVGSQELTVGGSNGLDGTIDYQISASVPTGNAVSSALGALTGKSIKAPKDLKFELAATGPHSSPNIRLVRIDPGSLRDDAKNIITDKANELQAEAEAKMKAETERIRKELEDASKIEAERLKKLAEDKAKNELEKLKKKFKF